MGHLFVYLELLYRSSGIAAADDRCTLVFSHGLCNSLCACFELLEFEYAHGAVPHNCLGCLDCVGIILDCLGADIHAHPAVGHLVGINRLYLAVRIEFIADLAVNREKKLNALLGCLLLQIARKIKLISFAERIADIHSVSGKEGICHTAADDDCIGLLDKVLDNENLVGNL